MGQPTLRYTIDANGDKIPNPETSYDYSSISISGCRSNAKQYDKVCHGTNGNSDYEFNDYRQNGLCSYSENEAKIHCMA